MTINTFIDKFQKEIGVFMLISCGFLPLALMSVIMSWLWVAINNGYGFIAFAFLAFLLFKTAVYSIEKLYRIYSNIGGAILQKELQRLRVENSEIKATLTQAESTIEKLHHLAIEKEKETERAKSWVMLNHLLKSGKMVDKFEKVVLIHDPSRSEFARQVRIDAVSSGQMVKWKSKNNTSMVQISYLLEKGYRIDATYKEIYQQDDSEGFRPLAARLC